MFGPFLRFEGWFWGAERGVFRVWSYTWSYIWSDMEKRNVSRGVTFGVTVLTRKTKYCPLRIARKNVIGVVLGCLGGGDNPTNWGGFGVAAKRGKRVFIGVSGGFDLLYMSVSVCATRVRGRCVWRVVCGVACHGMRHGMCQRITLHWQ